MSRVCRPLFRDHRFMAGWRFAHRLAHDATRTAQGAISTAAPLPGLYARLDRPTARQDAKRTGAGAVLSPSAESTQGRAHSGAASCSPPSSWPPIRTPRIGLLQESVHPVAGRLRQPRHPARVRHHAPPSSAARRRCSASTPTRSRRRARLRRPPHQRPPREQHHRLTASGHSALGCARKDHAGSAI